MPSVLYRLGLLLVAFGGFLMLGRAMFAGESTLFGQFGLVTMVVGFLVGAWGLSGATTDTAAG